MTDRTPEQGLTSISQESVTRQETLPSWIQQVEEQSAQDNRTQPWTALVNAENDSSDHDGKDLIRVERSVGGSLDPDAPFRTQNTSLAA